MLDYIHIDILKPLRFLWRMRQSLCLIPVARVWHNRGEYGNVKAYRPLAWIKEMMWIVVYSKQINQSRAMEMEKGASWL